MKSILLLRSSEDLAQERSAFRPFRIVYCPVIRIRARAVGRVSGRYDYGLVTSKHALQGLKRWPRVGQWVAMGKASAKILNQRKIPVKIVHESHRLGILKFFKKVKRGPIFFPRSSRADSFIPSGLRNMGFRVKVRHTYDTLMCPNRRALLKALQDQDLMAVLVTSPSVFMALRSALGLRYLRRMSPRLIAIGPTTAKSMRPFKIRFQTASEASLKGLRGLLSDSKRPLRRS